MLIEIHMIQNHSPSNLNRDDLGAPKTCVFGGVTRARISSQCLKRSIRNPGNPENPDDPESPRKGGSMFADSVRTVLGERTKMFPWLVEKELEKAQGRFRAGNETDADIEKQKKGIVAACRTIARAEGKAVSGKKEKQQKDKRPQTPQLIFIGPAQARSFVEKLLELKQSMRSCYEYFLDPATVFESFLEPELAKTGLTEEQQERALKAGWRIRHTEGRLAELRKLLPSQAETDEADATSGASKDPVQSPPPIDDEGIASEIAAGLAVLAVQGSERFSQITSPRGARGEPQLDIKRDKPKEYEEFVKALRQATLKVSVDIALFGRMTTSDYIANTEAAMQVAHAISTHAVVNETDYWTAVDDLGKAGGGAGHVDEAQFNSACFYKYFSLDWDQLVSNLAGPQPVENEDTEGHARWEKEVKPEAQKLAACTLGHFIRAAALTTPTGKQNSFAANNEPCGILLEIKKTKVPTNYANAFAEPAERIGKPDDDAADEKSCEGRSVACLADHVHAIRKAYGIDSTLLWYSPKLWRFPFKYWERAEDGKKTKAKLVTDCRFGVLGGEDDKPAGLVEAVVEALGLNVTWAKVKDAGQAGVQA